VTHISPETPRFTPGTPDTLPLISWEQAAHWDKAGKQLADAERWIPCIAHHSRESYALRVRGDSMTSPSGQLKSYPGPIRSSSSTPSSRRPKTASA
jgi:hypothetical protein